MCHYYLQRDSALKNHHRLVHESHEQVTVLVTDDFENALSTLVLALNLNHSCPFSLGFTEVCKLKDLNWFYLSDLLRFVEGRRRHSNAFSTAAIAAGGALRRLPEAAVVAGGGGGRGGA